MSIVLYSSCLHTAIQIESATKTGGGTTLANTFCRREKGNQTTAKRGEAHDNGEFHWAKIGSISSTLTIDWVQDTGPVPRPHSRRSRQQHCRLTQDRRHLGDRFVRWRVASRSSHRKPGSLVGRRQPCPSLRHYNGRERQYPRVRYWFSGDHPHQSPHREADCHHVGRHHGRALRD